MSATTDEGADTGVEFTYEGDLVTARDLETGVAASGDSKAAALAMLADALLLHEGGGEAIENEADFLRELDIDPESVDDDETPPPWL